MPSGAKKRKAAKKKKEKEADNNTTTSATYSHGDDDLKVHDEKESDGGESGDAGSPASQEHHNHQHPFTEAEEEDMKKKEETSTVGSMLTESEQMVRINGNGESTHEEKKVSSVQIDRELKPEDDSDSKHVSVKYVESVKESHGEWMSLDHGSSSSSSSSSSDDESHVEMNVVVVESGESKADAPKLVAASSAFADSVKPADLPEVTQVTDGIPVVEAYNWVVGQPKQEAYDPVVENDLVVGEPKEEAYDPVAANAPSVNLVKPTDFPELTQVTDGVPVIEAYSLVVETIPLVDSANVELVPVYDSLSVENALCYNVFELGSMENGKNESSGVPPVVMDMGSQPKEDKVASTGDENSAVSSGVVGIAAQADEDKLLPLCSVPSVDTSNDAEHRKDYVISEWSDSQPSVSSAPRPMQTTSWMSCCGLFEVFAGSNR